MFQRLKNSLIFVRDNSHTGWEFCESIRRLIAEGVTTFVEVGPGRVLCGLIRQIDKQVTTMNVEDEATLLAAVEALSGNAG